MIIREETHGVFLDGDTLNASNSRITRVDYLPEGIKRLELRNNPLMKITCAFPDGLEYISVSDCFLRELPRVPASVKVLSAIKNPFSQDYIEYHRLSYGVRFLRPSHFKAQRNQTRVDGAHHILSNMKVLKKEYLDFLEKNGGEDPYDS